LLAVNDVYPRHAMWAYATSLVNGGRTDRLASAPRNSTTFWSRSRESSRKGVEEPSVAGLYDINMMYPVWASFPRLDFRRRGGECPARDDVIRAASICYASISLTRSTGLGWADVLARNDIGGKVPGAVKSRIIRPAIYQHGGLHRTKTGAPLCALDPRAH
jgi:hypothetical protein